MQMSIIYLTYNNLTEELVFDTDRNISIVSSWWTLCTLGFFSTKKETRVRNGILCVCVSVLDA